MSAQPGYVHQQRRVPAADLIAAEQRIAELEKHLRLALDHLATSPHPPAHLTRKLDHTLNGA